MTHMHVAGSLHADATSAAPVWLHKPDDVNDLAPGLWSSGVRRDRDGMLMIADKRADDIVAEAGSPIYVIDKQDLLDRANQWRDAFAPWQVFYAAKSLLTVDIVQWVRDAGLNIDVASAGELSVALVAGMPPERIAFHGNNKSVAELRLALSHGVGRIVVDSADEITRLERLCRDLGTSTEVIIRVTTGVEAHTHEYIATAHEDQKFGFSITGGQALVGMVRCFHSPHLNLVGIHSHIGSQIFDTSGFEIAARRTLRLLAQFREATSVELPELVLGGGFGIAYTRFDNPATVTELANGLREIVAHECRGFGLQIPQVAVEPGRAISGPPGTALYTVGTVKPVELGAGQSRRYVSVDGGMSDNIRPALYAAEYSAILSNRTSNADPVLSRVVGVHCEGGDILVRDEFLPDDVQPGDMIAVPAAGAYSRMMASNYNMTPRPPVVAVEHGKLQVLLRRETLDDLLGLDQGVREGNLEDDRR